MKIKSIYKFFPCVIAFALVILCGNVVFSNVAISVEAAGISMFQAENCSYTGASVGTYGSGYSGSGYVEYINEVNDSVRFNCTAHAGYFDLTIAYSQGESSDQTLSLFVNSVFVKKINFSPTGNWDTSWGTVNELIYLSEGGNRVELRYTQGDGNVDLDYFVIAKSEHSEKMVIVPHEDDEIFAFCGSIESMVNNGDDVKVVLMTNGDYYGTQTGINRIQETVNALNHVGVSRYSVIVMGYGDATLGSLYNVASDSETITSNSGNTSTYGNVDLNLYDYHTVQTGSAAVTNRSNLMADLKNVIQVNKPDEIYTTSYYDCHSDHSTTYLLVKDTILSISQNRSYTPVLNESVVHGENESEWPKRLTYDSSGNPVATAFTNPFPSNSVPLYWSNAKKLNLTSTMLAHKLAAIEEYKSQNASFSEFDYSFYKSDEFYWSWDFANIASEATVTASSENTSTNQLAVHAVDGYIAGYDMAASCYQYEWATKNETSGAWINLAFDQTYAVNKIILNDRVTTVDNIVSAQLDFSDGSSLYVTNIPKNGTDAVITFTTKNIQWVKLTVLSGEGYNVGLTEFQVMEAKE